MTSIDRTKPPYNETIKNIDFAKVEIKKLDNGIPIHIINLGSQEIIKIEFIFKAGTWYQEKNLAAITTNKALIEGSSKFSASQISENIDFYGAHLITETEKDNAFVSLYTLNKYLNNTIEIFEDVIKNPIFPEKEVKTHLKNKKQEHIINSQKVNYIARLKFAELLFGKNHAYGKSTAVEDFNNITTNDLTSFHSNNYSSENCEIIVSGKIPDNCFDIINKSFGKDKWNNQSKRQNFEYTINTNNDKLVFIEKKEAIQSAIRVGKIIVNKTNPDYHKIKVVNTILGGYFGSRLMTNIREDKGFTYGISSGIVSLKHSGMFFIATEVGTNYVNETISEIKKEIQRLREHPVENDELNLVKNYMLGSMLRSIDGPFAISEKYKELIDYNLDFNYLKEYIKIIHTIDAKEVMNIANKYFDENSLNFLIVGKM